MTFAKQRGEGGLYEFRGFLNGEDCQTKSNVKFYRKICEYLIILSSGLVMKSIFYGEGEEGGNH